MPEPMLCCLPAGGSSPYCDRCDVLVGLDGFHVVAVTREDGGSGLIVTVESMPETMGCRACGVVAESHGRRVHDLVDIPAFGRAVRLRWRKRTWTCTEPACPVGTFTEHADTLARTRARLTTRACWWAIGQLRREHASVLGIARQPGCRGGPCGAASNLFCRPWPMTRPDSPA